MQAFAKREVHKNSETEGIDIPLGPLVCLVVSLHHYVMREVFDQWLVM
jgi:hypothetical protein